MKNLNGLETTLERVGRILAHKYHITVHCKGNECKTDGRTIWLPALPDSISESLWTLIRGELDHETAHILYSDFNGHIKGFRQKWGDFGFDMLNVIEDVRVNYAMQQEYPGSRQNIFESIDKITQTHPIHQMPLPVRFLCGLFLAGMGLPYNQYGSDAVDLIKPFFQEAERFKSLCSTNEACDMAESILKQLKQQVNQSDQQKGQQNQQQGNQKKGQHKQQQSGQQSNQSGDQRDQGDQGDQQNNQQSGQERCQQHNNQSSKPEDQAGEQPGCSYSSQPDDQSNGQSQSQESQGGQDSQSRSSPGNNNQSGSGDNQQNQSKSSHGEGDPLNESTNSASDNQSDSSSNSQTQSQESQDSQDLPSRSSPENDNELGSDGNQQNQSESSSGEGEPSNDSKDGARDHQNDSSSNSQSKSSPSQLQGSENAGAMSQVLSGQYVSTGHPFELQPSLQAQVQEEINHNSKPQYRVYDPSQDKIKIPKALDKGETCQALCNSVRPYIGTLRQQLIRILRAQEARFWVNEQEEGLVNSRRLYALLNQGSNKVFRQIQECQSDSVAVTLLIDLSGSMSGSRIHLAKQVAILFAETLNQLRIASEIIGFTTEPSGRALARLQQETGMGLQELSKLYARFFPCVYSIFKAFEEPYRLFKPRVPAMNAMEYTPIDDAILFSAKRIIVRKETRKIILALTDGEPFSGNALRLPAVYQHLQENLAKCEKAGIECVAIGIETDYVQKFFKEYVVVQDLPDLPKAFYTKFSELLKRPRQ